ncbi:hypothetical protein HLK59_17685 [Streptomyces sp. S3(2020)]|uniref:hypothetical protein n=1 Tax=Streptomyces sp. S3(2020) TaxID=2732044 RepID=UPI0014899E22|nr:hypothetical protein [Streptomyces sp. S3(2020)]NNN32161.1 hypothetical protein [Streptomyces sp. S3(2020)]
MWTYVIPRSTTLYEAVLTEIRGRRAAVLSFRLNQFDHRPRRVLLIEEERVTEDQPLPFVWGFSHGSHASPGSPPGPPVLKVVAAPGASVQLDGFPDAWTPGPGMPDLHLYRVQHPEVLPRLASDIPSTHLVGTYEVAKYTVMGTLPGATPEDPPRPYSMALDQSRRFVVRHDLNGTVIHHMDTGDEWTITVPALSRDPQAALDAKARYTFEIDLDAQPRPVLRLVTTPGVTVTLMSPSWPPLFRYPGEERPAPPPLTYSWERWEVDRIRDVPPLGAPLEPGAGWRAGSVDLPAELRTQILAAQLAFDVTIGFVPVLGDVVDIAELLYGVTAGRDKWGRRLDAKDLALLGVGAVLPFVGGAALKGARRLVRHFAEHADDAADLARRVREAGLSAEDYAVISKIQAMVKAGKRPPHEMWKQAVAILDRIPGSEPSIATLLNANGSGFAHVQLQEAYERYAARQGRKKRPKQDPVEWARSVTHGEARDLFVTLLGKDYAKLRAVGQAPPLNLLDIPRPDGYTDELLQAHLDLVRKHPRLWERLGKLLAEGPDEGAASIGLLRRKVSAGRFRILKGNVAEIFSEAIQHTELKRIAQSDRKYRSAVLVSGVKIRLKDGKELSAAKLFSDNIIVVKHGNRVQILAVFEVKSGFKGGEEVAEQIFEWIEGRLTDGSQIVFPKGTKFTSAKGRSWTTRSEIAYTWNPENPDVPTITGLAGAGHRHLITARGASALGVDSGTRTSSRVTTHQLDQTSVQLDFLCAEVLLDRTALSLPLPKGPLVPPAAH